MLWGLNWPVMKFAVGELSPWTFRTACVLISGLGLMALAAFSGERMALPRPQWPALLAVALLSVTGWHLFSAWSLVHMGGGRGAIVAYTMPIWAARVQRLVPQGAAEPPPHGRPGPRHGRASPCLIGPELFGLHSNPLGPLLMIGAAICWAGGIVAMKGQSWPIGIMALTGWQLIIGGVPIVLAWLVLEPQPGPVAAHLGRRPGHALCRHRGADLLLRRPQQGGHAPAGDRGRDQHAGDPRRRASSAPPGCSGEPVGWRELAALVLVLAAIAMVLLPEPKRVIES